MFEGHDDLNSLPHTIVIQLLKLQTWSCKRNSQLMHILDTITDKRNLYRTLYKGKILQWLIIIACPITRLQIPCSSLLSCCLSWRILTTFPKKKWWDLQSIATSAKEIKLFVFVECLGAYIWEPYFLRECSF